MARKNASTSILAAAQACLIEGKGDFEMSDVSKKAGVSEGLAYHYYKSKAGLLSAVIQDFYDRYLAISNKRFDGAIPWAEREKMRLGGIVAFLYGDPLAPIIIGKLHGSPLAAAVEIAGNEETAELSVRNIQNGIERGQISGHIDAHVAGAAITGAVRYAFLYAMKAEPRPSPEVLTSQLWDMIAGAIGLKP